MCPNIDLEMLELYSDWLAWLFVFDDQIDEYASLRDDSLVAALENHLAVVAAAGSRRYRDLLHPSPEPTAQPAD
jgi:hypothetical protein